MCRGIALWYIEFDDLLVGLWASQVGTSVVWSVVEHLCAILSNSNDVEEMIADRVRSL